MSKIIVWSAILVMLSCLIGVPRSIVFVAGIISLGMWWNRATFPIDQKTTVGRWMYYMAFYWFITPVFIMTGTLTLLNLCAADITAPQAKIAAPPTKNLDAIEAATQPACTTHSTSATAPIIKVVKLIAKPVTKPATRSLPKTAPATAAKVVAHTATATTELTSTPSTTLTTHAFWDEQQLILRSPCDKLLYEVLHEHGLQLNSEYNTIERN
jgi:hypothetical protein